MAALETRMLLLGAVRLFGPVNGYQIRRELLSWGVEDWAFVNPGSIYSGLSTLTKQGLLTRHSLVEGHRTVAVYDIRPDGEAEFDRLVAEAFRRVAPMHPVAFHTAFSMLNLVTRERALELLRQRRAGVAEEQEGYRRKTAQTDQVPPHVVALLGYWQNWGQHELTWLDSVIAKVEGGGLAFYGEPAQWQPPPGDPGHEMSADRERYRRLLGR